MIVEMKSGLVRFIVIDISGIYAQIYDEGYIDKGAVSGIRGKYLDVKHWRVLLIEN